MRSGSGVLRRWLRAGVRACRPSQDAVIDNSLRLSHARAREVVSRGHEADIARLRALRLGPRILELACFGGLLACGTTLAVRDHWALRVLGTAVAAAALNAVVLLLHEGMHGTLVADRRWNRWLSTGLGSLVLISFTAYQVMHLRHHRYLGDARDPDDYNNYSRSRAVVWSLHYMRLLVGSFLYLLMIPYYAWRFATARDRGRIVLEYGLMATLYTLAALTVPSDVLVRGWLLPLVVVGYMTNIRGFAQHGLTDAQDPFLASRSLRPNPLVAFLLLNENLHLEHHLFPEIPSYNLPRISALIEDDLPRVSIARSYLGFLGRFLARGWSLDESPVGVRRKP